MDNFREKNLNNCRECTYCQIHYSCNEDEGYEGLNGDWILFHYVTKVHCLYAKKDLPIDEKIKKLPDETGNVAEMLNILKYYVCDNYKKGVVLVTGPDGDYLPWYF